MRRSNEAGVCSAYVMALQGIVCNLDLKTQARARGASLLLFYA